MSIEKKLLRDINNTCALLTKSGLAHFSRGVRTYDMSGKVRRISWTNCDNTELNISFNSLEQYKNILEKGLYFCILNDGSIIRASYSIKNNQVISHNLLFWPAPFDLDLCNRSPEFGAPLEILEDIMSSEDWPNHIIMRTPIRIDYDPKNVSDQHPLIHMHMQNEDCRIAINIPVCFNSFIHFIYENCYPDIYQKNSFLQKLPKTKLSNSSNNGYNLFLNFNYI
ncbi:MAG: DUF2290 domain-containing protein [Alphaproteobacteria bacterium]|nr:DUF2290 domain-containing protein [Alphaproteobacteria bacterium]